MSVVWVTRDLPASGSELHLKRYCWAGGQRVFSSGRRLRDPVWQRSRYMKQLKMSKHECEAGTKRGSRAARTSSRKSGASSAIWRAVQHDEGVFRFATAVIVNPTHYAVAIKYSSSARRAPKVVAKKARNLRRGADSQTRD